MRATNLLRSFSGKNPITLIFRLLALLTFLTACTPKGIEVVVAEPLQTRKIPEITKLPATISPSLTETRLATLSLPTETISPTSTPTPSRNWGNLDPSGQTISFWHPLSYTREEDLLEIVKRFNRMNEWGITVKAEYQGDYGELFEKTARVLNTSEAPQLVLAYQDQAIGYWQAGALVDLNSLVKDPVWGFSQAEQEDFFPGIWTQDAIPLYENARMGIPAFRAMDVMYFNADWLAELVSAGLIDFEGPPQTPAQFRQAACGAVEHPFSKDRSGEAIGYELSISASRFASWSFAFGGELYDQKGNHYTYDSPASIEAMQFIQGLFLSGCAQRVVGSYGDQEDFGEGKLLFAIGTSTGLPFYKQVVDEGARFNWDVAAIPHTSQQPNQNVYGPSLSLLKNTAEGELAAWLFMKFFSGNEAQVEWSIASRYYPVRQSTADSMGDFLTRYPASQTIFELMQYGRYEPNVPGYESVRVLVSEALVAIAGGADVPETLQRLNEQMNTILVDQIPPT